jgi:hypothetical protein
VRASTKCSNKLLKIPQPKAEKDLTKALISAVGTEVEMEYEKDQIANELVRCKNILLTLLFALMAIMTAPKTI